VTSTSTRSTIKEEFSSEDWAVDGKLAVATRVDAASYEAIGRRANREGITSIENTTIRGGFSTVFASYEPSINLGNTWSNVDTVGKDEDLGEIGYIVVITD